MNTTTKQQGGAIVALLFLVLIISAAGYWLWQDYQRFRSTPLQISGMGVNYQVKPGTSLIEVANDLSAKGILRQPFYLRALALDMGVSTKIKAGEYLIVANTTPEMLLDQLVRGKVLEYSLTLIEGWTFKQALTAIRIHPMIVQTLANLSTEQIMDRLELAGVYPEGRFFPDTYLFPRGTTDADILKRAYQRMQKVLAQEWQARADGLPVKTPYEALILASIIEKETGVADERKQVAGVFTRRLQKRMRLQTDPTVIYGMGETYDGNIRRKDLSTDTPYNTYVHSGLTPTPIALPGRKSIHAALHPADGDALYFVATGEGGHFFSATYEEHRRAVQKYQIKRNKN
ncbi:MAG: endolytic transglycosylase MltG [Pseudomonadota bacterium]|nr:endolytic transglycosylase MltG [Pseudomonadota bacterium]